MHPNHIFFYALMALLFISALVRAEDGSREARFTLQVGVFADSKSAHKFVGKLIRNGERPTWGTAQQPGQGTLTRVFIGSFETPAQATRYGEGLVARRIIKEFLVKTENSIKALSRPRSVTRKDVRAQYYGTRGSRQGAIWAVKTLLSLDLDATIIPISAPLYKMPLEATRLLKKPGNSVVPALPIVSARINSALVPSLDTAVIPRPDPARMAFKFITGELRSAQAFGQSPGGLWLSGDTAEGLARLRWIVGPANAALLSVDKDGKVHIDTNLLARAARTGEANPGAVLLVADYVYSNEGLLLLVQLTQGVHRYRLHIGGYAPTFGQEIQVGGSVNLDNNYDSRINPYRRQGTKLNHERPPVGFDSMVAINPAAQWFNFRANLLVHVGHITFHELAEAYSKVALGLDYLAQGSRPGAHNLAIEREKTLKSQRPFSNIIITAGSNRLLRSEVEVQYYKAISTQSGSTVGSQR